MGCFLGMGSPNVAEQMAHSGFDFIVIEMEHNGLDMAEVQHMLMAINGTDAIPIVPHPQLRPGVYPALAGHRRPGNHRAVAAQRRAGAGGRAGNPLSARRDPRLRPAAGVAVHPGLPGLPRAGERQHPGLVPAGDARSDGEPGGDHRGPGGRRAVPGPVGPVPESRREPLRDAASGNGQGGGARDSRVRGERGRPGDRLRHPGKT